MKKVLGAIALAVLAVTSVFAQTSSLNGTVADPSGAVIPNAAITATNTQTGAVRQDVSDSQGRYTLSQLVPGKYTLAAKAAGFTDVVVNNVELVVNQPATVPIVFQKVGATSTTVTVEAAAGQINTTDASLGNVINSNAIVELPAFARNVAALLSFQPGVTNFGTTDDRSGSVNGGRSDQANVTLDGADVNNQATRSAFTSVLRVTPDSVEEFRTTTTNGGADTGRGSGADIVLITKSGTNSMHGSLYEFRRGTETAANDFFSNRSGVPIAPLLINLFGGTAGGPIKKNKVFFFLNYEGRRDASSSIVTRTIPAETLKQGIVQFHNAAGALQQIGPAQIKTDVDPLGIGVSAATLKVLNLYPKGNNNTLGDGLNTTGLTFTAPVHTDQNTYITKFDFHPDGAGKHSIFWRGSLQNDSQGGTPQMPGAQPNSVTLANNKGMASGWTAVLKPNLVSTFNYGFTRAGGETTGILAGSYTTFRGIDPIYGTSTGLARIVPVNTFSEDLSWSKGAHDLRFGGIARLISNRTNSYRHSFNTAITNASVINGSGADVTPASLGVSSGDRTSYQYAMVALLGVVTSGTGNYNYLVDGTTLPVGAPISRNFVNREGEFYAQDSWRLKRNLTLTYGVRYSLMPPVREANGQQISTDIPIGDWMDKRGTLAAQGLSGQGAGVITYILAHGSGGRPMYPYHKNWAPRLALAYSPNAENRFAKFLFGGAGRTSIRLGAGMYYDEIGQPLSSAIDATAFGLSSTISTPPNQLATTQLPRFTDFFSVPGQLVPPAPPGGFPKAYPTAFAITNSIDDKLKAPYTMNLNFSIGREFSHGLFAQVSYVGRLSRHNLVQRDLAMPTDLTDPKSGQTYFQAMSQLATLVDFQGVSVANLPRIPFFENMWATAAGSGFTASQAIAKDYLERSNPGDFTNVLSDMDAAGCGPTSTYSAAGKITRLACGVLGQFSQWSQQFSALNAWSSLGSGAYHSMQLTVRKRFSGGVQFDFNYTLSKSIDIGSRAESSGNFSGDFMINSWNASQLRSVSRYDALHQVNGFLVWELPFGRGRRFGHSMNRVLDAVVGGWQISGTYRQTSGLPFSISDGSRWATNWQLSAYATPNGTPVPAITSLHNATAVAGGGPNLWADPKPAFAAFSETLAGQTGSRLTLRGDGFFNIDSGLSKSFTMPWSEKQKLQFRWESFNLTNTVMFDPQSANVSLTSASNFGKLTSTLVTPRQMQFALRFSF
jgi:hypothetical protein